MEQSDCASCSFGARTGFAFDLCRRNAMLGERLGMQQPKMRKTGTTIVGVVCEEAVVLAADTRATEGPLVADKNAEKIHYIAPNMYCCGAGTSADTESTTALIASKLALHRLATGRQSRVDTALRMLRQLLFPYQGYISAALILGGVDVHGPQLHMIHPHGSSDRLPYATMGSGSLAAMAVLEAGWRDALPTEAAINLARDAVRAGILNDEGSGGFIDIAIVTSAGVDIRRNVEKPEGTHRVFRKPSGFPFPRGTTVVLSKEVVPVAPRKRTPVEVDAASSADAQMADS